MSERHDHPSELFPVVASSEGRAFLRVLGATYGIVALFVFVGFAIHRSLVPVIGPYSLGYLVFLITVASALFVPFVITLGLVRALGGRRAGYLIMGVLGVLLIAYGAAEVVFAATREHPFDPFLQSPGTRFESVPKQGEPGVVRIAALGGSTTRNAHLPDDERYPAILQRLLNEEYESPSWEVLNAGMEWWATKNSHINYATYLREWRPDVAVVMHAVNDLYRSFAAPRLTLGPYDSQWSHFYGPAARGAKPGTLLGSVLRSPLGLQFDHRWYWRWRNPEVDFPLSEFRSRPDFETGLRSFVQTLKADGVQVLLVTQPSLYKEGMDPFERTVIVFPSNICLIQRNFWVRENASMESMAAAMDAYNQTVLAVARDEGVEVLDLASRIPRTLEFFEDDVHYTVRGSHDVAREVASHIRTWIGSPVEAPAGS